MKTITLNNNKKIPMIGLGTWRTEKEKAPNVIEYALTKAKYTSVDCAHIYGNEKELGVGFSKVFKAGKVKRKDVFITSKLWNAHHNPKNVEKACKNTLKDLRLEYLDLYLIHWGIAFAPGFDYKNIKKNEMVKMEKISIQETWQAMEKLVKKGLVKSIGFCNFTAPMIIDLLTYAKIKPVVNQIEIHPYNAQEELVEFCQRQKIQVTAYSPFGSAPHNLGRPINDKIIAKIAKKYKKSPAQIILRWLFQRDIITIPKSTNEGRINENINIFDFKLLNEDMNEIGKLNKNYRVVNPSWGIPYFK